MYFTIITTHGTHGDAAIRVRWTSIYVEGERVTHVELDGKSNILQQVMLALYRVADAENPGWRDLKPCCHRWRVDRCDVHPTPDALASLRA